MTIDSQIFVLILSSVIFWSFVGFLIFCFCCDGDCCYCCNYCFEVIPEIVIEEKKDIEEGNVSELKHFRGTQSIYDFVFMILNL